MWTLKHPPNGRGLGHVTQFPNLGPLITFEWIEQSASNLLHRLRIDPSCVWIIKRPTSGRGLGHETKFQIFRTTLITLERMELSALSLVQT